MDPIAIVGIGCRFPGGVNDPHSFWQLLANGVDAIREIPEDRWSQRAFCDPEPGKPGKTYARWGGFLDQIDQFDPNFFSISAREAPYMDPQQRLLLEVAWESLEDAGVVLSRGEKSNTGVFVGVSTHDYAQIQLSFEDKTSIDSHTTTGGTMSIAANRISYCFNLSGPSIAIDTACSSALVAVHLACQSLWNRECDMALAGGVNAIIIPDPYIGFCRMSMLSPDGRCKAFDEDGNGFVRGEGAGIIVLKRLSEALKARDPIYAVIRATALNQDGRTGGITVPSREAQAALLEEVCHKAGIAPSEVDYVEAHGTGTPVGDPIEAHAIGTVMAKSRSIDNPCIIGSVKTNIGHLEAAAGIAGLIKAALAVKHRLIPPNLHFVKPNPYIPFSELRLRVPTRLEPWPNGSRPAIAGVNSFGFGGTNAHVILQEAPPVDTVNEPRDDLSHEEAILVPLSARSAGALESLAQAMRDSLRNDGPLSTASLQDIGFTASLRRVHHEHRVCAVVHSRDELAEHLEAFIAGERRPGLYSGRQFAGNRPRLAFVFSGQGPQWWAMGRELLQKEPIFRETIEQCDRLLSKFGTWSLIEELTADESSSRLDNTAIAQPAIFSLQVALAALWQSWGIEPDAVVGHSVGEAAAAHISGMLSLEDAARVMFHRGRCMDLAPERGKMLAVGLPKHEVEELLGPYAGSICLAAINSPSSVTVSGDGEALEQIAASLDAKKVFCRFLRVNYAFHSHQMEPVRDELMASLQGLHTMPATIPVFSTVAGQDVSDGAFDAEYWWQNVRRPVQFWPAIDSMIQAGYSAFVEISPHPVLSSTITECLMHRGEQGTVLPSLRRREEERLTMLGSLGALHTLGFEVKWEKFDEDGARHVPLPAYPWQRELYWHESEESRETRLGIEAHPLLGKASKAADPSWRKRVDLSTQRYLEDHRVQGHVVFPAAAYIEMAIAAARESLGPGRYILEEVEFQRALFISPETDAHQSLQFTISREDSSFHICSRGKESNQPWVLHACGSLRSEHDRKSSRPLMIDDIRRRCIDEWSKSDCYDNFNRVGLQFGPSFQGIERLWRRDGEALGEVKTPDHLRAEIRDYLFHPALLDSCLQVLSGALPLPSEVDGGNNDVFLPVYVEQIRFYRRPGDRLWGHARLLKGSPKLLEGEIRIYDADGNLTAEILGFRLQAVESAHAVTSKNLDDLIYELRWQLKPRLDQEQSHQPADYMPSPTEIVRQLSSTINPMQRETLAWQEQFKKVEADLDALCSGYVYHALCDLGWEPAARQRFTIAGLMRQLAVAPHYGRLLDRLLQMLQEDGVLKKSGEEWEVVQLPPQMDLRGAWKSIILGFPAFYSEMSLLGGCGERLAEVLRGEVNPLQLLFPEGTFTTAEHLYQDAPSFLPYNISVGGVVSTALAELPAGRKLRVLEIGAGTGGMTSHVLPQLPRERTEYFLTDASNAFFSRCEQKFRDYSCITYQVLDIEKDPQEQGLPDHSFDIILASDVLHATRDLRQALQHIQQLLTSQGLLILLESDNPSRYVDLVFGLTEGWWRFSDHDLRPSYPLLSREKWKGLLGDVGFSEVVAVSDRDGVNETGQVVLLARGAQITEEVKTVATDTPHIEASGSWLIFADDSGVAEKLAGQLSSQGQSCVMVWEGDAYERLGIDQYRVSPKSFEEMQRLLAEVLPPDRLPCIGVIHLWSLNSWEPGEPTLDSLESAQSRGCHSVMHFVQAWAEHDVKGTPQLWLVTRGAQTTGVETSPPAIAQSPLRGLGKAIAVEHPQFRCRLVDLSHEASETEIHSLLLEIQAGEKHDGEDEIAIRGDVRHVPRLVRSSLFRPSREQRHPVRIGEEAFRLEVTTSGILDNLTLRPSVRQTPGPGMVEIRVHTSALNFRDIMKALGIYPTEADDQALLGDECAGRINAIGEGVEHLKIGDEVIAIAPGSFASFVTVPAAFVVPKPPHLDFAEAVTIPITFLTAYYALHHLARMTRGEKVLIHAGTGGVGLAAIQIAQAAGAKVFTTAGNPEKREFLKRLGVAHVMDSRSLSFADEVMEITGGKGVDIVLNSLAGDAIRKSFSVLSPYGRFLEIGKRDIYQNSKLGLRPFRKNLSFFAIDLSLVMEEKPAVIAELMSEIMRRFEDGTFHPLPFRLFGIGKVINAFRHMAQAKHIGKIVVSMQDGDALVENIPEGEVSLRSDGTYLITGGMGGLGLTLAKWMVEKGARQLVLVGRNIDPSDRAKEIISEMEAEGAKIVLASADVSVPEDMDRVVNSIQTTLLPLRGIIHTAMVMDDGVVLQMNRERFEKVMAPKMNGAWNLHFYSRHCPLDFFIMFSSVASTIGNAGQGNYSAANAFLDGFAPYRRQLGLPATTVNWGHMAEVGYVARHGNVSERLNRIGLRGISPRAAMKIMGATIQRNPTQLVVLDIDWHQWNISMNMTTRPPLYGHLIGENPELLEGREGPRIRDKVLAAPPEERSALLEAYLREQVARVLATSAAKLDERQPLTELGLDSLMAVELKNRVENDMGVSLPTVEIMKGPSIATLTSLFLAQLTDRDVPPDEAAENFQGKGLAEALNLNPLVLLRRGEKRPPLFCLHSTGGQILPYLVFADFMDHDLPIYGIQSRALSDHLLEHSSISEMAEDYANLILLKQPAGFHHLLGHSLGGVLALATAAALEKKGQIVKFVGLLDPFLPGDKEELVNLAAIESIESIVSYLQSRVPRIFDSSMEDRVRTLDDHVRVLQETLQVLPPEEKLPRLMDYISENQEILAGTPVELVRKHLSLVQLHLSLGGTFSPAVIHAPLYLWWARERSFLEGASHSIDWGEYTTGEVAIEEVDGDHFRMMQPPYVDKTAARVAHVLRTIHGLS